ncbi:MAG: GHKL domain-containing protein [Clostridiaceae bacterium]|nr:GHKL domain-containing protein [Clostridiaceae bacterium]
MAHDVVKIVLRMFNDIFSVVYFFQPMKDQKISSFRKCAGFFVLFGMIVTVWPKEMWPYQQIETVAARFAIRSLITFLYLVLTKEGKAAKKLYLVLLLTIIYTNFTNIFMASPFIEFRTEEAPVFSNSVVNVIFVHLVQLAVLYMMLRLVRKECEFNSERKYNTLFIGIYLFISLVIIYMKQSMKFRYDYQNTFHAMSEMSIYYYALVVLVLAAVVVVERFSKTEGRKRELEVMLSLQNYRYQALVEREKVENKLRCLQHDMKNHLLAIQKMADDNTQVKAYIEQMRGELEETGVVVETGNKVIDGLMTQKLQWAQEQGIRVIANMDLRQSGFIKEIDLCAIVSNAVDNAVEASVQVKDEDKRRIYIKAGNVQGYLVFRFMNYFENDLVLDGDRLISNKADDKLHGLGIPSIKYALDKYHGSYSAEVDENHYFVLKIVVPVP